MMNSYTHQKCSTHMNAVIRADEIEVVIHTDYIIQSPVLLKEIKQLLRYHSANGLVGVEQSQLMPWEIHGVKFSIWVKEDFNLHNEVIDEIWQLVEEHILIKEYAE